MSIRLVLKLDRERGVHRDFLVYCGNCGERISDLWNDTESWGEMIWSTYDHGKPDKHYRYCPCCGCKLDWSVLQEV